MTKVKKRMNDSKKKKVTLQPLKEGVTESLVGAIQIKPGLKGIPFEKALRKTKEIVARKLK